MSSIKVAHFSKCATCTFRYDTVITNTCRCNKVVHWGIGAPVTLLVTRCQAARRHTPEAVALMTTCRVIISTSHFCAFVAVCSLSPPVACEGHGVSLWHLCASFQTTANPHSCRLIRLYFPRLPAYGGLKGVDHRSPEKKSLQNAPGSLIRLGGV
jgi:hypothetical protein